MERKQHVVHTEFRIPVCLWHQGERSVRLWRRRPTGQASRATTSTRAMTRFGVCVLRKRIHLNACAGCGAPQVCMCRQQSLELPLNSRMQLWQAHVCMPHMHASQCCNGCGARMQSCTRAHSQRFALRSFSLSLLINLNTCFNAPCCGLLHCHTLTRSPPCMMTCARCVHGILPAGLRRSTQ